LVNQGWLQDVILGCIKASRESQKELYKYYFSLAMGICMRYSSNYLEAEEIVNDSFLKVFTQIKKFTPSYQNYNASFVGWMKKIIINTAIDSYRKYNKTYGASLIDDDHLQILDNAEMPIDKMAYNEIIQLVQKLSPTYRTVFNLYVIDGLKHEEIAEQLNISIGTSKSNLAKAKNNIQKMLMKTTINLYEQRRAI
jgi:RNA polymerase sigma factor (sigma-70 family)